MWPTCDSSQVGGGRSFALAVNKAGASDAVCHRGRDSVLPPSEPVWVVSLSAGQDFHLLHHTPVQTDTHIQGHLLGFGRGCWGRFLGRLWISSNRLLHRFLCLFLSSFRRRSRSRGSFLGAAVSWICPGVSPSLKGACSTGSGFTGGSGSSDAFWSLDGGVVSDLREDWFLSRASTCGSLLGVVVPHCCWVLIRKGTRRETAGKE